MENWNLTGYLIYLPATFYITVVVGRTLYRHGEVFLVDSFHSNILLARTFNRFLLTGYYLLNLGYAAVSVNTWETLYSLRELLNALTSRLGFIIISLALMHYFNMYFFSRFSRHIENLYKHH